MTEKLYYQDAYLKEFTAVVTACSKGKNGYDVILDRTAFYPEGGGQPADYGYIGEARVTNTREREGIIIHVCDLPLSVNSEVTGRLDWSRRFLHMQQHTGEHILSGIVHRLFGYDNVGFHMGKDLVTVDFNGILDTRRIQEIEKLANGIVFDNERVEITYPDPEALRELSYRRKKELEGEIRIVTVPGADICACCGTHTAHTGEIGMIKVSAAENYKSGVRLTLQIGWRALEDYSHKVRSVKEISNLLSARPDAVAEAAARQQEHMSQLKIQLSELRRSYLSLMVERIPAQTEKVIVFERNLDGGDVRRLADMLLQKAHTVAVFSGNEEEGYKYALGMREGGINELGNRFNAACRGRGGGKGNVLQGSAAAGEEQIRAFLERELGNDIQFSPLR